MIIVSGNLAGFRSPLLELPAAQAQASELRATETHAEVRVIESNRAKHPTKRYFVFALPFPSELAAILAEKQAERMERARAEGESYVWAQDPDHSIYHCLAASGEVYEVDLHGRSCSCPDWSDTCRFHGLDCKHMVAYRAGWGQFYQVEHWSLTVRSLLQAARQGKGKFAATAGQGAS